MKKFLLSIVGLFRRPKAEQIVEVVTPVKESPKIPRYNRPEEWPFSVGIRPYNIAVHWLFESLVPTGSHIYYKTRKGHISTLHHYDKDTWRVKEVMWWISGGQVPEGKSGTVRNTCGDQNCVNHLHLTFHPYPKRAEKVRAPKESRPPEEIEVPQKKETDWERIKKLGDRTKCASAKLWFKEKNMVDKAVKSYNNEVRPKGKPRLHSYPCPWCDGYHFTSHDPRKHKYKATGSWK